MDAQPRKKYPVIVSDALWDYLKLDRYLGENSPKIIPLALITGYLTCHDYLMKGENSFQIYVNEDLAVLLKLQKGEITFGELVKSISPHRSVTKEQELNPKIAALEEFFKEIKDLRPRYISDDKLTELKEKWNSMGLRKV